MRPKMTDLERAVWAELRWHKGKRLAITYRVLARKLNAPERAVRNAVSRLVNVFHKPICASYHPEHGGYYIPATQEEIEETYCKYYKHALSLLRRASELKNIKLRSLLEQLKLDLKEV